MPFIPSAAQIQQSDLSGRAWTPLSPSAGSFVISSGLRNSGASGPSGDGVLSATPIIFTRNVTVTQIDLKANVVGGASSVCRAGIYADTGLFTPGTLLLDAGTVPTNASTSVQSLTGLSLVLTAFRVYWLAGVPQGGGGAAPQMYGVIAESMASTGCLFGDASANSGFIFNNNVQFGICYTNASVSGALPGTFTASPGTAQTAVCVCLQVT